MKKSLASKAFRSNRQVVNGEYNENGPAESENDYGISIVNVYFDLPGQSNSFKTFGTVGRAFVTNEFEEDISQYITWSCGVFQTTDVHIQFTNVTI